MFAKLVDQNGTVMLKNGIVVALAVFASSAARADQEQLRAGCDRGIALSCSVLANELMSTGTPADKAAAAKLYARACDAGFIPACGLLANMYKYGNGVPDSPSRAAEILKRACDAGKAGSAIACSDLGELLMFGVGVAKDEKRALGLNRKGCDAGFAIGCYRLGTQYLRGLGVDRDEAKAATLFERACRDGEVWSCGALGNLYAVGKGVHKDEKHAVELFKRACDAGYAASCLRLGVALIEGNGIAIDKPRGLALIDHACDRGEEPACFVAKRNDAVPVQQARGLGARPRKEQIRATIRDHLDAVTHCYEAFRRPGTPWSYGVVMEFAIAPEGQVQSSNATSSTSSQPDVERCIVTVSKDWVFPPSGEKTLTIVQYPFRFETAPASPERGRE
ncbi:MAG TPA: AgmX/PglI C-terminal domain-containing protein [Polyangia bacterium]|nr:AgmX/PglI C-terminal domain-containing protein [Polyangia bacterium]